MSKIHTSRGEVTRAFNKVRMELWNLKVLWDGSKLESVDCVHDSFPVECVFRAAFGGAYGKNPAEERGVDGWENRYVSEYATSATQEDFAETFMFFVKHNGKIPAKFAKKPAIRKKWKAVAEIVKRVAAAKR